MTREWWQDFFSLSPERQSKTWKTLTKTQKNEIKIRRACFELFRDEPFWLSKKARDEYMEWAVEYLSERHGDSKAWKDGKTSWHTIVAHYPEQGYRTQVRIQVAEGHKVPHTITLDRRGCSALYNDWDLQRSTAGDLFRELGIVNGLHLVRA